MHSRTPCTVLPRPWGVRWICRRSRSQGRRGCRWWCARQRGRGEWLGRRCASSRRPWTGRGRPPRYRLVRYAQFWLTVPKEMSMYCAEELLTAYDAVEHWLSVYRNEEVHGLLDIHHHGVVFADSWRTVELENILKCNIKKSCGGSSLWHIQTSRSSWFAVLENFARYSEHRVLLRTPHIGAGKPGQNMQGYL